MATVSDFQAHISAAIAARGSADWPEVRKRLDQARMALSSLPEGKQGGSDVRWGRDQLAKLADEARRAEAAADSATKGMQFTKVTYAGATD